MIQKVPVLRKVTVTVQQEDWGWKHPTDLCVLDFLTDRSLKCKKKLKFSSIHSLFSCLIYITENAEKRLKSFLCELDVYWNDYRRGR